MSHSSSELTVLNHTAMKPMHFLSSILLITVISLCSCLKDPCEGTSCQNGGVCMDGSCNCPVGYTGSNCGQQVTPLKMKVTAISVTRFPGLNDGLSWDPTDGPDIYFKMSEEVYPLAQPEYLVENADPSTIYAFTFVPFDLRFVTAPYKMELFDYDGVGIPSQKMGELFFTPYASSNGFPTTIILDDGGSIAFKMEVEYIFPDKME